MAVSTPRSLSRVLGIRQGHCVSLINAPQGFPHALGELPDAVKVGRASPGGLFDVIVFFAHSRAELQREFRYLAGRLQPDGGLWISWPRKGSGVATDLNEAVVRDVALARGLVDNKQCAIDARWSGLRLVLNESA
ncbi:DUF3052 family protein [bacterium]|nr:MAG: DUF3052 family protein [bacterium]RIK61976.1 MAG: DUF3052 domain-containing protein [Planctomycetota bacterium]